jgi:uncharacterized protein YkwD
MSALCLSRAALAGLCLMTASGAAAEPIGDGVLQELNFARTEPAAYAQALQREAGTTENRYDVEEAIDFLRAQRPLPPLRPDSKLGAAALDHAVAQGRAGGFGHVGADGSSLSDRLHRHGVWAGLAAEDISYGYSSPRDVVRQLIVDSGVPGRGHRNNIFEAAYQAAGAGCGGHPRYGALCVIDFAGALVQR